MNELITREQKHKINKSKTFKITKYGCWSWNGSCAGFGYGVMSFFGRSYYLHRIAYRIFVGEIPNKIMVCHSCDNPKFFNPNHLFLGTAKDNVLDMIKKGRARFVDKGTYKGKRTYTLEQYKEMRKMRDIGFSKRDIKQTFNISPAQLHRILNNKTTQ